MLYTWLISGETFLSQDNFTGWMVGWMVQDDHWPPNVAIGPFRGAAINLNISLIITKKYCVVKTIQKQL